MVKKTVRIDEKLNERLTKKLRRTSRNGKKEMSFNEWVLLCVDIFLKPDSKIIN